MGKALNRQFTKEDIQMANMHMHMKRCSISFVMGGEQVKNQWDTIIYTLEWMVSEDVEKSKFYTLVIGMQNGTTILENILAVSFKVKHMITMWPNNP